MIRARDSVTNLIMKTVDYSRGGDPSKPGPGFDGPGFDRVGVREIGLGFGFGLGSGLGLAFGLGYVLTVWVLTSNQHKVCTTCVPAEIL